MRTKVISRALVFVLMLSLISLIEISPAIALSDTYSSISVGDYHTAVIKADGSLWTWGWNWAGEIGDGTLINRYFHTEVMDDVIAISANYHYTLAIRSDGSLWSWGYNNQGQLGDGTSNIYNQNDYFIGDNFRSFPIKIMDGVVAVSTGVAHTLAVKADGSLWVWGDNWIAPIRGNGTQNGSYTPVKIMDGILLSGGNIDTRLVGASDWAMFELKKLLTRASCRIMSSQPVGQAPHPVSPPQRL